MHSFHIRYRNTQGTLMRILNAASRRALDLPKVLAEAGEHDHQVTKAQHVQREPATTWVDGHGVVPPWVGVRR